MIDENLTKIASCQTAILELGKDIVKFRSELKDVKNNSNINSYNIEKMKKKINTLENMLLQTKDNV